MFRRSFGPSVIWSFGLQEIRMSKVSITIDGVPFDVDVRIEQSTGEAVVEVNGETMRVALPQLAYADQTTLALVDRRSYEVVVDRHMRWIRSAHRLHRLEVHDRAAPVARPASGAGRVKAPLPGLIARVLVGQGEEVAAGQPLLVLEAMKMENEIRAPRAGTVAQINIAPGQQVALGMVMAEIV
jgi:biotin carboxyl carrier protein